MLFTFHTNKPASYVMDFLTDMDKFVEIHPVVYKIDKLSPGKYLFYEKLVLFFIPFQFSYVVYLYQISDLSVIMKTEILKLVDLHLVFTLKEYKHSCVVSEEMNLGTRLPVKRLIYTIFKKMHMQLFKNLSNRA